MSIILLLITFGLFSPIFQVKMIEKLLVIVQLYFMWLADALLLKTMLYKHEKNVTSHMINIKMKVNNRMVKQNETYLLGK